MGIYKDKTFAQSITKLIQKENLSHGESKSAFSTIFKNETNDLQQGGFLAALVAKGETRDEVAGCWEAIYNDDTEKVDLSDIATVDNCGTGMDDHKTFNVSTAASIIAASSGIPMARHGARAITSVCGTVDIAEALGVDVDCSVAMVAGSIRSTNLGLFNGMSPMVHPAALGRILSQVFFGTTLNISASLANPALPGIGVRGVYKKELLIPVLEVMREIGYTKAITVYGTVEGSEKGIDEASVSGTTYIAELTGDGSIKEYSINSVELGLGKYDIKECAPKQSIAREVEVFLKLFTGKKNGARKNMVLLNAALVLKIAGLSPTLDVSIAEARALLESGKALATLKAWVSAQNSNPEAGNKKLQSILERIR